MKKLIENSGLIAFWALAINVLIGLMKIDYAPIIYGLFAVFLLFGLIYLVDADRDYRRMKNEFLQRKKARPNKGRAYYLTFINAVMKKVLRFLKRLFHIHRWTYYMGKCHHDCSAAWNRGCDKCGRIEISEKTGNQFLYRGSIVYELPYSTKEEYFEEVDEWNERMDKIRGYREPE